MVYGKVSPQARDLEEAVLGAIMLEAGAFDLVAGIFPSEEVFYIESHRKIYQAMTMLSLSTMPLDLLTVVEQLRRNGDLDSVGGPYYVSQLTNSVVSSANVEAHARIVYQKYVQRELIRVSSEILQEAYEDTTDAFDLMDHAEAKMFSILGTQAKSETKHIGVVYDKGVQELAIRMQKKEDITGVPSGFPSLDEVTAGWQPTDLIILAARPSVGKTAFVLNIGRNASMDKERPTSVAIFSLEMSKAQLNNRLVSAESDVPLKYISRGTLTEQEYQRILACKRTLATAPIYLDDTPSLNIFELRAKCRRLVKNNGVGLIIIDYLQLMSGAGENRGNREQEISKISRDLKQMAKELNVPVIALSQLSRDIEKRAGGKPQLSDLRESGAIEQDADMVIFLYRPDSGKEAHEIDPAMAGDAEVKIAKHRNGELKTIAFKTKLSVQKFIDLKELNEAERTTRFVSRHEAEARFALEVPPAPADPDDDLPF